jgi:hypothetical protein
MVFPEIEIVVEKHFFRGSEMENGFQETENLPNAT